MNLNIIIFSILCSFLFINVHSLDKFVNTGDIVNTESIQRTVSFKNPLHPKPGRYYKHLIVFVNKYVEQIRLDFLQFELQPPAFSHDEKKVTCIDDSFGVEDAKSTLENKIPILCGNETGQHIYLHVNANKIHKVYLYVQLGDYGQETQRWNIQITQIQGPRKNVISPLNSSKLNSSEYTTSLYAKPECLQYFPERRNDIRSFGFLDGIHFSEDYTICFSEETCNSLMSFKVEKFILEEDDVFDCDVPCFESYLEIKTATLEDCSNPQNNFCGKLDPSTVITTAEGVSKIKFFSTGNIWKLPGFLLHYTCDVKLNNA